MDEKLTSEYFAGVVGLIDQKLTEIGPDDEEMELTSFLFFVRNMCLFEKDRITSDDLIRIYVIVGTHFLSHNDEVLNKFKREYLMRERDFIGMKGLEE